MEARPVARTDLFSYPLITATAAGLLTLSEDVSATLADERQAHWRSRYALEFTELPTGEMLMEPDRCAKATEDGDNGHNAVWEIREKPPLRVVCQ